MSRLRHVATAISPFVELEGMTFPSPGIAERIVRSCPPGTFAGEACQRDPERTVLSSEFTDVWLEALLVRLIETRDGRAVPGPSTVQRALRAVSVSWLRVDDVVAEAEFGAGLCTSW
jgi:hypothetical protein